MTIRVDFYLLADTQPDAALLIACRLIEKAYYKNHTVYVYCDDQKQAEMLDELLWTYKEDSFIPHHLQGEGPEPAPPIQIGYQQEPRGFHDILLNLSQQIAPFHARFRRIMHIISHDESCKALSRQHYKSYREKGYALQVHSLSESTLTSS